MEGGADKDKANGRGETPLHLAIGQRLPDPVRALLKARADQETYLSCSVAPIFPFLVAAPLKMVQAPKRIPFFSRATEQLRYGSK